jgi:hypothetical protein
MRATSRVAVVWVATWAAMIGVSGTGCATETVAQAGDGGESGTGSEPEPEPDLPPDSDPEPEPDPEPQFCDVSQFEAMSPLWQLPLPSQGANSVRDIVVLDEGFVVALYDNNLEYPPRLQRYADDGELVWDVEADLATTVRLEWDGAEFLYASGPTSLVRHDVVTGVPLAWKPTIDPVRTVYTIEAQGTLVVVGGGFETQQDDHTIDQAWISGFDQYADTVLDDEIIDPNDESVFEIAALTSGGYLALIGGNQLQFRGYGGARLSFDLPYYATPMLLEERPEGLLVIANNKAGPGAWIAMVNETGQELWHMPLEVCGPPSTRPVVLASMDEDRLWISVSVPVDVPLPNPLWAEVGLDGQLLSIRQFELPAGNSLVGPVARRHGRTFAAGATGSAPNTSRWLARYE